MVPGWRSPGCWQENPECIDNDLEVNISLLDQTTQLLRELSETIILPRFGLLAAGDISEKSPGEVVTIVDQEMEQALSARLPDLLQGSIVVGEETVAADPSALDSLEAPLVWLVDPIDGTSNFIAGTEDFAVMVALLQQGEAVASWVYSPLSDSLTLAELGSGTWRNGQRVHLPTRNLEPSSAPSGVLYKHYLPAEMRTLLESRAESLLQVAPTRSAGIEYPRLLDGLIDYILYWRTLPWDHVPGALLVNEAGGRAARLDGREYRGADQQKGLLVAPDRQTWEMVQAVLTGKPTQE